MAAGSLDSVRQAVLRFEFCRGGQPFDRSERDAALLSTGFGAVVAARVLGTDDAAHRATPLAGLKAS